ncbi:Protein of unknown function DUF667 [Carpediemonas membranifera]|uniref:CFA20 domain-containing protein n=1 Tax=Carpediemonas membranifera TaxID=201153 RepID=A0A8J6B7J0_9EUKA|nr:Protein of unknown function DUF667 [Carpediemonas membranifera]|eukprot:KAG9391647.1 Protein of unknown function DUF667 [Carpediemonas membranifera]
MGCQSLFKRLNMLSDKPDCSVFPPRRNISELYHIDSSIKRNSLSLKGKISEMRFSGPKNPWIESNGLKGRYLYIQLAPDLSRLGPKPHFSLFVYLNVKGSASICLRISNLYQSASHDTRQHVSIVPVTLDKWATIVVDLHELVTGVHGRDAHLSVRQVHINSSCAVHDVITSDELYDPDRMPTELWLPRPAGMAYSALFDWIVVDTTTRPVIVKSTPRTVKRGTKKTAPTPKQTTPPATVPSPADSTPEIVPAVTEPTTRPKSARAKGSRPKSAPAVGNDADTQTTPMIAQTPQIAQHSSKPHPKSSRKPAKKSPSGLTPLLNALPVAPTSPPPPPAAVPSPFGQTAVLGQAGNSAVFDSTGRTLIFPAGDRLAVLALDDMTQPRKLLEAHGAAVIGLGSAVHRDLVASVDSCMTLRLWNMELCACVAKVQLPGFPSRQPRAVIAVSDFGEAVLVSGRDSQGRMRTVLIGTALLVAKTPAHTVSGLVLPLATPVSLPVTTLDMRRVNKAEVGLTCPILPAENPETTAEADQVSPVFLRATDVCSDLEEPKSISFLPTSNDKFVIAQSNAIRFCRHHMGNIRHINFPMTGVTGVAVSRVNTDAIHVATTTGLTDISISDRSIHPFRGEPLDAVVTTSTNLVTVSSAGVLCAHDRFSVELGPVVFIAASPLDTHVVTVGVDSTVTLVCLDTHASTSLVRSHTKPVSDACTVVTSSMFVTCGLDRSVRLWDSDTLQQRVEFSFGDETTTVSLFGEYILSANGTKLNILSPETLGALHSLELLSSVASITPDLEHARVYVATADETVAAIAFDHGEPAVAKLTKHVISPQCKRWGITTGPGAIVTIAPSHALLCVMARPSLAVQHVIKLSKEYLAVAVAFCGRDTVAALVHKGNDKNFSIHIYSISTGHRVSSQPLGLLAGYPEEVFRYYTGEHPMPPLLVSPDNSLVFAPGPAIGSLWVVDVSGQLQPTPVTLCGSTISGMAFQLNATTPSMLVWSIESAVSWVIEYKAPVRPDFSALIDAHMNEGLREEQASPEPAPPPKPVFVTHLSDAMKEIVSGSADPVAVEDLAGRVQSMMSNFETRLKMMDGDDEEA